MRVTVPTIASRSEAKKHIITTRYVHTHNDEPYGNKLWTFRDADNNEFSFTGNYYTACNAAKKHFADTSFIFLKP